MCGLRAERERKIESCMAPHVLASGGGEIISADACGGKEAMSTTQSVWDQGKEIRGKGREGELRKKGASPR